MFAIGQLIVHGKAGVCRVEDITVPGFCPADRPQDYYVLRPVYQDLTVYSPVEGCKVFMRPLISAAEAVALIDEMPTVQPEIYHNSNIRLLAEHYRTIYETFDCRNLVALTVSLHAKKKRSEAEKRKFGQVDENFLRQSEDLLFSELAAALGIDKQEVPGYIQARLGQG